MIIVGCYFIGGVDIIVIVVIGGVNIIIIVVVGLPFDYTFLPLHKNVVILGRSTTSDNITNNNKSSTQFSPNYIIFDIYGEII